MSDRGALRSLVSVVSVVAVLAAAACGSDDSTESSTTSGDTSATRPVESASPVADSTVDTTSADSVADEPSSTQPAPTGTPIELGVIAGTDVGSAGDQTTAGARAAAAAFNASGGVNGQPIEISYCDDEGDPNTAAKCARDFAANPGVTGLVGVNSNYQDVIDPVLEAELLASVGHSLLGPPDFTSPMVFPVNGGPLIGTAAGAPICINDLGGESIALAHLDLAVGAQIVVLLNTFALAPFGTELVKAVPVPVTATDVTAQAAELVASGSDCVIILAGAESAAQVITALHQQGYEGQIITAGAVFSGPALIDAVGEQDAEGVVLAQSFDYSTPLGEQFVADMEAIGAEDLISDLALQSWLGVRIIADTAKPLPTIDRASLLAALETTSSYDTQGLTAAPIDFTARKPNPEVLGGSAPNVLQPYAMGVVVENGELTPITGAWQNAFGGPSQ